jgi:hypothetical protein
VHTASNVLPAIRWTPLPLGRTARGAPGGPRVAVVGKRNHLHFDEHVAEGFVDAGCEVRHYAFNRRPLGLGMARAGLRIVGGRRGARIADAWHAGALSRDLASFRPDLVFFASVFFIPRPYLEAARALSPAPVVVGWDGDALARFAASHAYAGLMDLVCVTERSLVEDAARVFGRARYLAYAANPRVYRDMARARERRAYFCGAHTAEREALLAGLGGAALTVKGPGWERFGAAPGSLRVVPGKVSMAGQAVDYASHLAVWNEHQKANNPDASLNMRDFEAPASGALLVSDHRGHMQDHFDVDSELLTYRDRGELGPLLERALRDEKDSAARAARAAARVRGENTYRHRAQEVLAAL